MNASTLPDYTTINGATALDRVTSAWVSGCELGFIGDTPTVRFIGFFRPDGTYAEEGFTTRVIDASGFSAADPFRCDDDQGGAWFYARGGVWFHVGTVAGEPGEPVLLPAEGRYDWNQSRRSIEANPDRDGTEWDDMALCGNEGACEVVRTLDRLFTPEWRAETEKFDAARLRLIFLGS